MVIGEGRYPESHLVCGLPAWLGCARDALPWTASQRELCTPVQAVRQGVRGGRRSAWASLRGRVSSIQVPGIREGAGAHSLPVCTCSAAAGVGVGARAPPAPGAENSRCASQGPVSFLAQAGRKQPPVVIKAPGPCASTQIPQTLRSGRHSFPPSRRVLHGPQLPWTQCVAICLMGMSQLALALPPTSCVALGSHPPPLGSHPPRETWS